MRLGAIFVPKIRVKGMRKHGKINLLRRKESRKANGIDSM